jgi:sugar lactone lactonase YvrE
MATARTTEQAQLGEGARFDARRDEFLWVDILGGRVHRHTVTDDGALTPVRSYQLPTTVGAVVPIDGDDGWLLAAGRGFVHLSPDGGHRTVLDVAPPHTRMNDAACDPQGRCWAGALADDHHEGGGSLFRLDGRGCVERVLEGMTIPNGMGWSLDGDTMYIIDSGPRVVHAFDFEGESGAITNGRPLISLPADMGAPDGMTVDTAGDLWVAVYNGSQVRRYSPDGEFRKVYEVPAAQSTCCAFAGPGMHRLYVTTGTEDWTDEQRRADPAAGLVYQLDTDATGAPAMPFRPDSDWWLDDA